MLLYYSLTSSICSRLQLYSHRSHRPYSYRCHDIFEPSYNGSLHGPNFQYLDSQSEVYTKHSLEYWDTHPWSAYLLYYTTPK